MEHVVLVIHLMLAVSIVALVLLQRSEGGGLGIGGGNGGLGQFASARSTANALTKLTTICAILFFATSLILAYLAGSESRNSESILDKYAIESEADTATGDSDIAVESGAAGEEDSSNGVVVPETKPPEVPMAE